MLLNFDRIDVAVNNSGILALNASISTNNSIEGAYIVGYTRPINQLPIGPMRTRFNTSYIPEISQEPNYAVINKLKDLINDSNYYGERVEFAGIHGDNFFLDNYSFQISPNNLIEANVSYSTFWQLCGSLKEKSSRIDYINQGDLKHAWSTYILSSGDYINTPVYEFNYSFNANWQPIYTIGRKFPVEVKLLNITESITFDMDDYRTVLFTGENVYNNLLYNNNGNLEFNNISLLCETNCEDAGESVTGMFLNISGFKIQSAEVISRVGEMVRTKYTATRYK